MKVKHSLLLADYITVYILQPNLVYSETFISPPVWKRYKHQIMQIVAQNRFTTEKKFTSIQTLKFEQLCIQKMGKFYVTAVHLVSSVSSGERSSQWSVSVSVTISVEVVSHGRSGWSRADECSSCRLTSVWVTVLFGVASYWHSVRSKLFTACLMFSLMFNLMFSLLNSMFSLGTFFHSLVDLSCWKMW